MGYIARDLRLSPGSPCIDAGNPEFLDPDGTRSDMGAIPFAPGPTATEPGTTWGRIRRLFADRITSRVDPVSSTARGR